MPFDFWGELWARIGGPLDFRLVLQPAMAMAIAARAGVRDARANRPPFLWTLLSDRRERRALLRTGWRDVGRVFLLAWLVDAVYQIVFLQAFRPLQGLIVAVLLAFVPYGVTRGLTTRLVRRAPRFRRIGA
jgi:hypothetical protein